MKIVVILCCLCAPFTLANNVIPLERTADGHLLVRAQINGKAADFVLDTGATGTVIESTKLALFDATIVKSGFNGIRVGSEKSGKIITFPVNVQSITLGKFTSNIKQIYSHRSNSSFSDHIAGVVGQDVLIDLHAILDISAPQLIIANDNQTDITSRHQSVALKKSTMGFSYVNAIFGEHKVNLIVDSGAPQSVFDEQTLTQMGFKLSRHPSAKTVVENGLEIPMKQVGATSLSIGDIALTDNFLTTDFTALMNAVSDLNEGRVVGVLGLKELRLLNALIDLKNNQLHVSNQGAPSDLAD